MVKDECELSGPHLPPEHLPVVFSNILTHFELNMFNSVDSSMW